MTLKHWLVGAAGALALSSLSASVHAAPLGSARDVLKAAADENTRPSTPMHSGFPATAFLSIETTYQSASKSDWHAEPASASRLICSAMRVPPTSSTWLPSRREWWLVFLDTRDFGQQSVIISRANSTPR